MSLKSRIAILTAALLSPPLAGAQVFVDARVSGALDSLRFLDGDSERRGAFSGDVEAEYRFAAERARVWYSLDAASEATPGDWSTMLHAAGATYRFELSSTRSLFVSAAASWRINGDAWAEAGYRALQGRASLELRPAEGRTLRVGYRIDQRAFPDLAELNQVEHDGFASALLNFQTRTTLIGEVHLGVKSYGGDTAAAVPIGEVVSSRGRGAGGLGPAVRTALAVAAGPGQSAGRVAWLVRVAQSLADRTGLSLQYEARHTFGDAPPLVVTTPLRFDGDGVYDDPYASDARGLRVVLKQELGTLGTASAWGSWGQRDYTATLAYGSGGEPTDALRQDRTWRAGAGWTVPLFPGGTGDVGLALDVGYDLASRSSNDAFYDFTSHAVGAALSLSY